MKNTYILGVNLYIDPSAALIVNGSVESYCEEERLNRIKHSIGKYPILSIKYCLNDFGITMDDVDSIAINWDIESYSNGEMEKFYNLLSKQYPKIDKKTIKWQKSKISERSWLSYNNFHYKSLSSELNFKTMPPIMAYPHHLVHAHHSYKQSGFDEALCITVDGSGDKDCTVLWKCNKENIDRIYTLQIPHSLGWLYSAITEYLGFESYDGEYKVMGMASYGEYNRDIEENLKKIIDISEDGIGYSVDPHYIHYGSHSYSSRFTDNMVDLLGVPPRKPFEEINNFHNNLAYGIQNIAEEVITRIVEWGVEHSGIKNICIGGGVGLNVKINSKIRQLNNVDKLFANPLCSDSGAAIGSALYCSEYKYKMAAKIYNSIYFGPEFSNSEIQSYLDTIKVKYTLVTNIFYDTALMISKGMVIGWFQGRMEGGPRALGNRSILADPRVMESRDKVNSIVKFREMWRPFCPSIIYEDLHNYICEPEHSPYMVEAFIANNNMKKSAPAVVHVDGTARIQTVSESENIAYYRLLSEFKKITGVPILLNTSFNVKGEPVVCTPKDAIRTFFSSGLDVLVLGDYIIKKQ